MLEIDGQFGELTEIKDLMMKKEEVSSIVNNMIINGDGNVLNSGNKAHIHNLPKIEKITKEDLIAELTKVGVANTDIDELEEIIDTETPDILNKRFGVNVNKWIGKMLGKALDGTWEVGIGAAGSILAQIIGQYYGM